MICLKYVNMCFCGLLDVYSCVGMSIHGTCCSLLVTLVAGAELTEEALPIALVVHCL